MGQTLKHLNNFAEKIPEKSGDLNTYWHGDGQSDSGCKCGETNSCKKEGQVCNCDAKSTLILRDSQNVLSDFADLPVTQVRLTIERYSTL